MVDQRGAFWHTRALRDQSPVTVEHLGVWGPHAELTKSGLAGSIRILENSVLNCKLSGRRSPTQRHRQLACPPLAQGLLRASAKELVHVGSSP